MKYKCFREHKKEKGKLETHSPIYYIKLTDRMDSMLVSHSTEYTWQAFYIFNAFWVMMSMILYNTQTKEWNFRAIEY